MQSASALKELADVTGQLSKWYNLAWSDIRLRYRRTTLGPFWITLGLGATIISVGLLYGVLFKHNLNHYLPYFASGLIIWTFLTACMTEGCYVFMGAASILKAVPAPLSIHIYRCLLRQIITMWHNFILIVPLWLVFQWSVGWEVLLVIPGLLMVIFFGLGMMLSLSIIAARFRDVPLLVTTALQLLFLLTPIVWTIAGDRGSLLYWFAFCNPFFHLLEIVRSPLVGELPSLINWVVALAVSLGAFGIGVYIYAKYRNRVVFWV